MTILHLADLHFHQPWFHWLSDHAPAHDLLVIAGDLLDLNHPASHDRQVQWVTDWIRDYGRPLAICSGNHDLVWDSQYNVWWPARWLQDVADAQVAVDGQVVEANGITLFNCSATGASPRQAADIWVVHAPPEGPAVGWRETGHPGGDPNLAYSIKKYRPQLVLCGHVHRPLSWYDHFEDTLYLNPGCDADARFPNHILIDLSERNVRRVRASTSGSEQDIILAPLHLPVLPARPLTRPSTEFATTLTL